MAEIELQRAISEIRQACEEGSGEHSPFFFIIGAGISAPTIPLASEIEAECKGVAKTHGRNAEPTPSSAAGLPQKPSHLETYSHWFDQAFPQPKQRQQYLRKKIEGRVISPAVFRLAHLLQSKVAGNLVVTTNFDDFLSRALTLFGEQHIVCDHPSTVGRISVDSGDIQIVHVHGTYWFYDCCNLKGEIEQRADNPKSGPLAVPSFLETVLWRRSPIVLGYSGWEGDVIMTALNRRLASRLPFNLYWFCYQYSDSESLPAWIRNHPDVRLVSPPPPPAARAETPQDDVRLVSPPPPPAVHAKTPQDGQAGKAALDLSPAPRKSEDSGNTFSAQRILDQLNLSFNLKSPLLTRNPARFLAGQLQKSLVQENDPQNQSDAYKLRDVIADLQDAAAFIEQKAANQSPIGAALERIKDAFRRSASAEAIRVAGKIRLQDASPATGRSHGNG